jgi:hypothetical protein
MADRRDGAARRRHAEAVQGRDQPRHPRLDPGLAGVPARQGAPGGAERAGGPLRRHRAGRLVAVRRPDQHADDAAAGRQRPHLLPVAHHRAVLADPLGVPDRAQPPPERVRLDLGDLHRVPRLQLPHPPRERHHGDGAARRRLEHLLGRQEPQHPRRRLDDGLLQEGLAAGPGLRPLLRLHRRRDQPVVSGPGRGQPLHRPALWPRGRLPPLQGPGRQGAGAHPRRQAVRAGQALVPVVLPRRQPRPPPRPPGLHRQVQGPLRRRLRGPTASGSCRG